MNIRQFQCFAAVASTGSYTKAADNLFVTRQALSKTIKQLEKESGKQLFFTGDNSIELTEDGREFLREITPILVAFESLERKYNPLSTQELTLAIAQGALHPLPKGFLDRFIAEEGALALQVEETSSDAVVEMVRTSEVEIGILGTHPSYIQEFDSLGLAHPGYYISVPLNHTLADRVCLELEDIDGQHFVTLGKRNHLHRIFMEECEKAGVCPDILAASTEESVFERYRQQGQALSFACAPKSIQPYGDVNYIPLGMGDAQLFGTYALRRKDSYLSMPARRFWEYLESHRYPMAL